MALRYGYCTVRGVVSAALAAAIGAYLKLFSSLEDQCVYNLRVRERM